MQVSSEAFKKTERLCSRKAIETLFEKGSSFYCFPFQVVWKITPSDIPYPAQMAVSVSKKAFRRAVKRNLVKRRVREVYRKNKQILYDSLRSRNISIIFIIIFKNNIIPDYQSVQKSVKEIIERLIIETGKIAVNKDYN